MNNPKIFLAALIALSLVLALLLFLLPPTQNKSIHGVVVSQTITQSLDGQRRYLNVQLDRGDTVLVTAPTASTCPEGSIIVLQEEPNKFVKSSSYRFSSCSSK
ncbi:hypothetical protein OPW19_06010 [Vibrio europaeus]|uniref:hypothetical protein n=1 Tax=Vibrio europaeus TaxID=300876 RepID=UPI00233F317E|nr:hypothetical protein [Vibrio europaeus]MDC5819380.1 hypothetical protein [Vibrio europaeus]MDC5872066.1 hypothetical protein [Vibrio europaeus]